jgi:hypothetical protein
MNAVWVLGLVIFFLVCLVIYQQAELARKDKDHAAERQDLYNRIMANNLTDYASSQPGNPPAGRNFVLAGIRKGKEILDESLRGGDGN